MNRTDPQVIDARTPEVLRGVREVARFLRIRNERVAALLASGAIPSRRVGRVRLVSRSAVIAWLMRSSG